jgi:hypothetical protein
MKELLYLIPSYIQDSKALLEELSTLHIPKGAKLFMADAVSMYTNIDTNIGILTLRKLFTLYNDEIATDFPTELFINTLEIIINNNIFSFGDTFWVQLQGTALGTPAAPLYSILTFGIHENTQILYFLQKHHLL